MNQIDLKQSLLALSPFYRRVFFFGFFTNLMLLAPSWYMLEVYDRVINSRNLTTLLMLTIVIVGVYALMEMLEWVRKNMMHAAAQKIEAQLSKQVFNAIFLAKLKVSDFPVQQAFSDFKLLKESLYSSALMGLIDLPFAAIFIVTIFLIHPTLGILTLLGLAIQIVLIFYNQYRINPQMKLANKYALEAQQYFSEATQRAEVVQAMSMLQPIEQRWAVKQQAFLFNQAQASEVAAASSATSKCLQTLQSSMILGLACYLVINNDLAQGGAMMIISSVLAARVLSPLVQLVTQWQTISSAQEAYKRLDSLLKNHVVKENGMPLPPPTGDISVETLNFAIPTASKANASEVFLRNIQFKLKSGEMLLITGPSASGKTTLSKLLAGLYPPNSGKVRYDGVDVYQWNKEELGQYIGYLPQSIELMDGTLAENIARFGEVDTQKLNAAIELLGLQSFIATLTHGLGTQIGHDGEFLSGGRRQLVGLARAIYGSPRIVILDEPNANLDEASERVLQTMIKTLKAQGTTFVVISHLHNVINVADYLMVMMSGQVFRYGKPSEVMASLQTPSVVSSLVDQSQKGEHVAK